MTSPGSEVLRNLGAAARANPTYLGWGESSKAKPGEKIARAVACFRDIYNQAPAEVHCHPEDAAAVGDTVNAVPVIGDGRARHVYLVGPVPGGMGR